MLGGQKIEEQAIGGPAVDDMAAALSPDEPKMVAGQDANGRGVALDGPGVDRLQPQAVKGMRQQQGHGAAGQALPGKALVAEDIPQRGGVEVRCHVAEGHQADGRVVAVGGEGPEHMEVSLRHDLEGGAAEDLLATAEVQPAVIGLLRQPCGRQLDGRVIEGQQSHASETAP